MSRVRLNIRIFIYAITVPAIKLMEIYVFLIPYQHYSLYFHKNINLLVILLFKKELGQTPTTRNILMIFEIMVYIFLFNAWSAVMHLISCCPFQFICGCQFDTCLHKTECHVSICNLLHHGRPVSKMWEIVGQPFCQIVVMCNINIISCTYIYFWQ